MLMGGGGWVVQIHLMAEVGMATSKSLITLLGSVHPEHIFGLIIETT